MQQEVGALNFLPLNMVNVDLPEEVDRRAIVYKELRLPFFKDVSIETIGKIARNESDSFSLFNSWLTKRVGDLVQSSTDNGFESLLSEIDEGVARISVEAKKIRTLRALQGCELTTFGLSLCALIPSAPAALHGVAAVTGTMTAVELIKEYTERRKQRTNLKANTFYLPYLARQN